MVNANKFEVYASTSQKVLYTLAVFLLDGAIIGCIWEDWPNLTSRLMIVFLIPVTIYLIHYLINILYKIRIQVNDDTICIKGITYHASQIDSITMGIKQTVYIVVAGQHVAMIDPFYSNYNRLINWATKHGIPCNVSI